MNERHATEAPEASGKGRKRYPPTERGVRVRVYPFEDQETVLIAKCRARAIIWNWTCDVFDRTRAKALPEANDGDIVLARIGPEVTLKRLQRIDAEHVELQPVSTNSEHEPIRIGRSTEDTEIVGIVVGAIVATRRGTD